MAYQPRPIEVAGVTLPPELQLLVERLAASVHDAWALQRLAEGWSYGPKRDDHLKQHPDLVPYEDLSESEKQYDRNTVEGTLRAIMALGYQIIPPEECR